MLPTLLPQHQPENCAQADHIPCDLPFPDLAFKNALLKPTGGLGCSEHQLCWAPCLAPYNRCHPFLRHNLGAVGGLYSTQEDPSLVQ